jgi:hypothetical protein
MNTQQIIEQFEESFKTTGLNRPEDRVCFYLGVAEAVITIKSLTPDQHASVGLIACDMVQRYNNEFRNMPWYRKLFRRV